MEKVERLVLAMRRCQQLDEEGLHVFSGYLDVTGGGPSLQGRYAFDAQPYREAVKHLIVWAREHPEAELYWLRLEQKPEPVAMQLSEGLAKLLREDPVAFLKMMDPTMGRPQKLDVSMSCKVKDGVELQPAPIPSGYDTLADAFGDFVYVRLKGNKTESVWDGRWYAWHKHGYQAHDGEFISIPDDLYKAPGHCRLTQDPLYVNEKWARYKTKNLLEVAERRGHDKFFLPRRWNKEGPWISREDLRKKYDEFLKEKEACSRTHIDT